RSGGESSAETERPLLGTCFIRWRPRRGGSECRPPAINGDEANSVQRRSLLLESGRDPPACPRRSLRPFPRPLALHGRQRRLLAGLGLLPDGGQGARRPLSARVRRLPAP